MTIKIKNKDIDLKFTFNSFLFMEEFDISVINELETKPFKLIPVVRTLLFGAVNHNPDEMFSIIDVSKAMGDYINNGGDLKTLMEELWTQLETSDFFKSLQKKTKKK